MSGGLEGQGQDDAGQELALLQERLRVAKSKLKAARDATCLSEHGMDEARQLPRICVFGAGGIGCWLATALLRAGTSQLVLIARGDHGRAIRDVGLELRIRQDPDKPAEHLRFGPGRFECYDSVDEALARGALPVQFAILAVKTYQVPEAAWQLAPLLAQQAAVVTAQNGLEAPHQAAEAVGPARVLGGVCLCNCWVSEPGVVEVLNTDISLLELGEAFDPAGVEVSTQTASHSTRCEEIVEAFAGSHVKARVAKDGAWESIWKKAAGQCCLGPVSALCRVPLRSLLSTPQTTGLIRSALLECVVCSQAAGHLGSEDPAVVVEWFLQSVRDRNPVTTTSITRDVLTGRPSELQDLTGGIQRAGLRLGVPTPTHDFIMAALLPQELRARGEIKYELSGVPGGAPHIAL